MSFESKLVSAVNASFKGLPGYKPINTQWVENTHRLYMSLMAQNHLKPEILADQKNLNFYLQRWDKNTFNLIKRLTTLSQAPYLTVDRYIRFLRLYAIDGQIPYEKYDPVGYVKTQKLQKGFESEKDVFQKLGEKFGEPAKKLINFIPLVALALGGIVVYNITKKD